MKKRDKEAVKLLLVKRLTVVERIYVGLLLGYEIVNMFSPLLSSVFVFCLVFISFLQLFIYLFILYT